MLSHALMLILAVIGRAAAQEVSYGIGSWPEAGRGNHRALVRVDEPADAVWVHIPWRRRDQTPETKDVRVLDSATGQQISNVVRVAVTQEYGDFVFQAATSGLYEVYYLPYTPGTSNFDSPGAYFPPQDTADPAWVAQHGLAADGLAAGAWRSLPPAEVLEIQARSEFDRMDPMEVIATEAEVKQLLEAHPGADCLLFPEDRRYPIRMAEALPARWVREGPRSAFQGEAQPNEFYVFQIGVYAARKAVSDLTLGFSDLKAAGQPAIPASALRCFNLGGADWLGRPTKKAFSVGQGRVRALWIGVSIPRQASETYDGTVVVRPEGQAPTSVTVRLTVAGPILEDRGDGELSRLSRLRWLDSTLGLDDEVLPPFTPLVVQDSTVSCLDRQVRFGRMGLPESITSRGREILAAPMALVVTAREGAVPWKFGAPKTLKKTAAVVEHEVAATSPKLAITTHAKMESDGCLMLTTTLRATAPVDLTDVSLEIPMRRDCAPYMMGMSKRGGLRPPEWHWKWDVERADNMVWLGDVDAGLQLQLRGEEDVWQPTTLRRTGVPASWSNGGRGGCDIGEAADRVMVRAYSGSRKLAPGEEVSFRFRLLITPFKPIDRNHWNWRYGDVNADGNILHLHHGCPENPYINYPFLTTRQITELVQSVKAVKTRRSDFGRLTYPAEGNLNPDRGALHIWATIDFDPSAGGPGQAQFNQALFGLEWPNQDQVGFYWNIDDRGLRAYVRSGPPSANRYPILFGSHSPDWQRGQRHLLTLSWGDELAIYVDGRRMAAAPYRGTLPTPLAGATLLFQGSGFVIDALKITDAPFAEGAPASPTPDDRTLLLDTFSDWDGGPQTHPERAAGQGHGTLAGAYEVSAGEQGRQVRLTYREAPAPPKGLNIYYTLGQLSNHVAEMWALRSLGDEVFTATETVVAQVGETTFGKVGGGYPWLREHLVTDYIPGWRQPLPWLAETDAAIETQGLSRWHNYYVEGMSWLMLNTGLDGLYLDGIGYDREIMKRVAKVMARNAPTYRVNFHSGDSWSAPWDRERRVSPANAHMEHLPYLSNLWFGELFDYNMPPDYWLVEISGLPFGLTGEMLNYQDGGNPYRGMVYGMTGRQHPSAPAMWRFWDDFGIQDAEWLGYWSPKCPVRTDRPDVLATVYRKPNRTLIAFAHWPATRTTPEARARASRQAPTVDGRLAPGEWEEASRLGNFTRLGSDELASDQTEAFVTHDAERLYLAFRCVQPPGPLVAQRTQRDEPVWEDDAVEFFLQPGLGNESYFQVIVNSRGTVADTRSMDLKWDGDWTARASVGDGYWAGELSIPWSSLGMGAPEEGAAIGLNVCRDQQTPSPRLSSWSPVSVTFHEVEHFGRLVFSAEKPSTREEPRTAAPTTSVRLKIDWQALGLDPAKARLTAPPIDYFQGPANFAPGDDIPIEQGKGWLLVLEGG